MRAGWSLSRASASTAHTAVDKAVTAGLLPRVSDAACVDCREPAEEYHHANGYAPRHHLAVVPLCHRCHRRRHVASSRQKHERTIAATQARNVSARSRVNSSTPHQAILHHLAGKVRAEDLAKHPARWAWVLRHLEQDPRPPVGSRLELYTDWLGRIPETWGGA